MSFIYENSCKDKPKFVLDDITSKLYRLEGMSRKEVLYESKAREVIQNIHRPPGRACRKGGVRKVLEEFKSQFYCKGMDGIVRQTLKECSGTCNRLKALKTGKAPPNLIQTYAVMERVQNNFISEFAPTQERIMTWIQTLIALNQMEGVTIKGDIYCKVIHSIYYTT